MQEWNVRLGTIGDSYDIVIPMREFSGTCVVMLDKCSQIITSMNLLETGRTRGTLFFLKHEFTIFNYFIAPFDVQL